MPARGGDWLSSKPGRGAHARQQRTGPRHGRVRLLRRGRAAGAEPPGRRGRGDRPRRTGGSTSTWRRSAASRTRTSSPGRDGEPVGVVKITNPAFTSAELEAQELAAARIAAAAPDLRIATTTADAAGAPRSVVADDERGTAQHPDHRVPRRRHPHRRRATSRPRSCARMGELAARTSLALADFDHAGLDRVLQWDPQVADRVVDLLAPASSRCGAGARQVTDAAAAAWARLGAVASDLPRQAVHLDLTDDNVVCTHRARHPAARRAHRLRRRHPQLGRRRTRDHDLVGAAPRGRRAGVGAARDPGVPRAAAAVGRRRWPRSGRSSCCAAPCSS